MPLSILILTGQSGSGKSTAIRALEDAGYFCVDNIPTSLVEQLVGVVLSEGTSDRLMAVIDIREKRFLAQAPALITRLRQGPHPVRMMFLEAQDEVVISRYSETRRLHPLDSGAGLRAAIMQERTLLAPLRELADETFDTSRLSPHDLRAIMRDRLAASNSEHIRVALLSFGFKHGVPLEADMVLDVRFLNNPYFDLKLRPLTGLSEEVRQFVVRSPEAQTFVQHAQDFLAFLLPQYQKEGKRYLTVAIGCTGGRHRSVAIARELCERLAKIDIAADLRHRDVKEDSP